MLTQSGWHQTTLLRFPVIIPTLKYGDEIIETDTTITHSAPETVSCELSDAGPPRPELLELVFLEGSDVGGTSNDTFVRSDEGCNWSNIEPLQMDVNNLTRTVRHLLFHLQLKSTTRLQLRLPLASRMRFLLPSTPPPQYRKELQS